MTNRIVAAISRVLRDSQADNEVHFHQGASARPAVCFDDHCAKPRMDVR